WSLRIPLTMGGMQIFDKLSLYVSWRHNLITPAEVDTVTRSKIDVEREKITASLFLVIPFRIFFQALIAASDDMNQLESIVFVMMIRMVAIAIATATATASDPLELVHFLFADLTQL
ncbi:hypothetical protein ACJX0J_024638, partial [Zea mays]